MGTSVDELFTKRLQTCLKCPERENRRSPICVIIEMHTSTTPVHRKELVVRLTDESDLFFLYTLKLSEEDFQSLKTQQGLLVDFGAFPQKFIDLLELCLQEEHKESPKFIIDLVSNGTSGTSTANLNLIETNPFKHLTHLSLKFIPGTDSDIKKYLATCLKTLKEQRQNLNNRLEQTETDLGQQLRQAREALSSRTLELDNLKAEWAAKTSDFTIKHKQEVTSERERALQTQTMTQQKYDSQRKELEQAHMKIVKQLEARLHEADTSNKDLMDRKYKSEASIRELRTKLGSLEEEHLRTKQEVQSLRKNNSSIDAEYHEQEKLINQLRTKLAVTEQAVKDKEEVMKKTTDLLSTEQDSRKKGDSEMDRKKRHIHKLEMSIKTMTEELVKGNEIIKKLQGEIKNYHTKLKLRTQVTQEQEKLLGEKNREMEEMRRDLEKTGSQLRAKEEENKKLNESLEATVQKLEESRQLLKTNENVINWLNKQVTENQLGGSHRHGAFEMNSGVPATSTATFRPHTGMHNFSAPTYGGTSRLSSSVASSHMSSHPPQPHPHKHPQVQYQHGASTKTTLPAPIAKSSPIGTIPEERPNPSQARASPVHLDNHMKKTQSDPVIDTRYFQQAGDAPVRNPRTISPMPTSIHFSQTPPAGAMSNNNPNRLSKDAIVAKTSKPSSQPPLASAYFPQPSKIS